MEVTLAIHGILWTAIITWLVGVIRHMRIINNGSKNTIKAELMNMILIRESKGDEERRLSMEDIGKILHDKNPESVVLSNNGVLRIRMHDGHFIVGYPSKEVAKTQIADHLHDKYLQDEDRKAA